ncbi:SdrD B-like domain-containing protein [Microbacterium sp. ZW T5_56]|uniref:DUF7927 domain-containing protein n=1 Tax=Microbacterium sp. ZW T5_56 TaxID=3378081 RepID=UPI0038519C71
MTFTHPRGRGDTTRLGVRGLRRSALVAGVVALAAGLLSPFAQPAVAAPGDGTLTVTVVREANGDGARTATLEPGLANVQVVITDNAGASTTLTTNASGVATFNGATSPLVGGKYRVEVINPNPGALYSAPAATTGTPSGTAMSSNEEFVDISAGKTVSVLTGFWNPTDYCQNNPTIVNACQPGLNTSGSAWETNQRTLFTSNYALTAAPATITTNNVTGGGVYGIGVRRPTTTSPEFRVFTGAYAKRAAQYGAAGSGAIFVSSAATATTQPSVPTIFTTVPNTGTTGHSLTRMDVAFRSVVGKESLGDVDVSDDGRYLFAVNMFDKQIYVYSASDTSGAAPILKTIPIPSGCADANEWRPMGMGERDGLLYVGGVCSTTLSAAIHTMTIGTAGDLSDMAFTGQTVLNQTLTYPRDNAYTSPACGSGIWRPWVDTFVAPATGICISSGFVWAQPLLGDIEFRNDGAMMVSFRDRNPDMYPYASTYLDDTTSYMGWASPAGDLLLACSPTQNYQGYVFDVNGGCPDAAKNAFGEFFKNEQRAQFHNETYFSGIVYVPTELGVVSDQLDAGGAMTNGMSSANVNTSATIRNLSVTTSFGKGAGLADIEALCNNAPLQIGNRVWFDANNDGVQGADETALAGVTVQLIKNGVVIGTRTTNARGEYYFSTADADLGGQFVPYGGDYTIKFIAPTTGTVDLGGTVGTRPWADLSFTSQGVGSNKRIDSNPNPADGTFVYTAGGPGQNDHTIDAGYVIPLPVVPAFGKTSDPVPGSVVKPGDSVTYTVTAVNPSATQSITTGTLTDNMAGVLDKATLSPAGAVPVLSCDGPVGATCGAIVFDAVARTVVWTASAAAPLSAATTAKITYTVVVDAGATGTVGNVLVEPNITTEHPIITWDKVAVPAAGTLVNPGDVVSYTISVKNTGAVASNAFSVSDDLTDVVSKADLDPASITIDPAGLGVASYDAVTKLLTWTGVLQPGEEAKVTYQATVKADAFGEMRNHYFDKTVVNPISASLVWKKVDPQGDVLAGSEWELTPVDAGGVPTGPAIVVVDCVEAAAAACTGADTDPDAGEFLIIGLKPGTYSLVETKAPVGFVLLPDPVAVTVLGDAAVTTLPDIQNQQQGVPEIPLTGGWGSDYFFAGGGVLIVLAAGVCFLVWRRRTHQEA